MHGPNIVTQYAAVSDHICDLAVHFRHNQNDEAARGAKISNKEASEILHVPIATMTRARGLLRSQSIDVARSYGLSAAGA
jgi:hypothetical protein